MIDISLTFIIILIIIIIIVVVVVVPCDFFPPASADGLSQESELVSSGLIDSSQYFSCLNNVVDWMVSFLP